MSRLLPSVRIVPCALLVGLCTVAVAQERGPAARPAAGGASSTTRLPRAQPERTAEAGAGQPRPEGEALRVEPVSKELDAVLKNWERASARINKLEGPHHRYEYDKVFGIEKRAEGQLWYEAPDKGRIDLKPSKIGRDEKSKRVKEDGKPYDLKAGEAERWVCTGLEVIRINDEEKTVEMFPIPPQHQGANIMEGPLPFLFGMPAEKAKLRFKLTLLKETPTEAWIKAIPRWKSDAEQYQTATIILDKTEDRFLPSAVQLIDPSGNTETVYSFRDLKINPRAGLIFNAKNPLKPDLGGYKMVNKEGPKVADAGAGGKPGTPVRPPVAPGGGRPGDAGAPGVAPANEPAGETVPNMIGLDYEVAQKRLTGLGFKPRFKRGVPASDAKQVYHVYDQFPAAQSRLEKGGDVILTLYDKTGGAERTADSGASTTKK